MLSGKRTVGMQQKRKVVVRMQTTVSVEPGVVLRWDPRKIVLLSQNCFKRLGQSRMHRLLLTMTETNICRMRPVILDRREFQRRALPVEPMRAVWGELLHRHRSAHCVFRLVDSLIERNHCVRLEKPQRMSHGHRVSHIIADFLGQLSSVASFDMTKSAADQVYATAGIGPEDIDVVELHDCFTTNEVLSYESLGLTPLGTAEKFIADGDNTYGGRVVTNPSGGLMSKGHPLGASGLAQCAELVWQLRGQAAGRQVDDVRLALQHNIGLGGAAVVTLYEKVG